MLKTEKIDVWGFGHAIRGMRNPMNSWEKSDSKTEYPNPQYGPDSGVFMVRENDLNLMRKLFKGGTEHRKYLRQIMVSMDIIAPLYWWKEFDTYKVGTVVNSCSIMHKIQSKEFRLTDFSHEHLVNEYGIAIEDWRSEWLESLYIIIEKLNCARQNFLVTNDKKFWWQMIQLLPSSYNQKRTVTMNYENVFSIIKQRTGHKLDEWRELIEVLEQLPYVKEIGGQNV